MEKLNFHLITLGNARSQFVDVIRAGVAATTAITQYNHFIATYEIVCEALRAEYENFPTAEQFESLENLTRAIHAMYEEVQMHFDFYKLPPENKHQLPAPVIYSK